MGDGASPGSESDTESQTASAFALGKLRLSDTVQARGRHDSYSDRVSVLINVESPSYSVSHLGIVWPVPLFVIYD